MQFDQLGIHIGSILYLRYYGLILMAGALAAAYLASLEARRRNLNPDYVWDGLIWALVGGIVGARAWHILTPGPSLEAAGRGTAYYLDFSNLVTVFRIADIDINVPAAFALGEGGLGIPGAVMGGLLGIFVFARRNKIEFVSLLDIVAPALPLGQAIGRWANFVNQELYGPPTTLPWGLRIDNPMAPFSPDQRFHPLFLYESIGNLLICLGVLYLARRRGDWLKKGDLFLVYLIAYPALRFLMEFLRLDSAVIIGLNTNQSLMLVVGVAAAAALSMRHRRVRRHERKSQPPPSEAQSAE